jgi:acetyl-CoA carboxylase biotin carboxyl carrier protein
MDIKQIQDLIRFVSKSGVNEVSIEQKDFKITIKTNETQPQVIHASIPAQTAPAALPPAPIASAPVAACSTCRPGYIEVSYNQIADDWYFLPLGKS